jgi:hypothetical protein
MYWFLFVLGGIALTIFLLKNSLNKGRQERISNLPITDISILQNRFKNEKWEFTIFKPATMSVLAYISPNGGSMSFFPYGEVNTVNGAPNEIKNIILKNIKENKPLPNYIVACTFSRATEVGPYLMVDFYTAKYDRTFSIGFLNQKCGFDLRNKEQANMFMTYIQTELAKMQ